MSYCSVIFQLLFFKESSICVPLETTEGMSKTSVPVETEKELVLMEESSQIEQSDSTVEDVERHKKQTHLKAQLLCALLGKEFTRIRQACQMMTNTCGDDEEDSENEDESEDEDETDEEEDASDEEEDEDESIKDWSGDSNYRKRENSNENDQDVEDEDGAR
ncbi:hypothetical protein NQD34_012820 [Periophthalmus magnuspinnatus]|nr:hypothetical protein NQD34_012820 [Periophthalmus magnuspinnatus]